MIIAGVDAGKEGAVAILNTETDDLSIINMPLDEAGELDAVALFQHLEDKKLEYLIIEDVYKNVKLLRMVGEITAVAKLVGAKVCRVAIVTWKTAMLGENTKDKEVSVKACQKLRPTADLRRTARCKKLSDDRAEAVLLALYAKQQLTV